MKKTVSLFATLFLFAFSSFAQHHFTVVKTNEEWKKQLSPEAFAVTRQEGTERAYSGAYWDNHQAGTYNCVCCGQP